MYVTSDMHIYVYRSGLSVLPLMHKLFVVVSFLRTLVCQIVSLLYLFFTLHYCSVPLTIACTVRDCYEGDKLSARQ